MKKYNIVKKEEYPKKDGSTGNIWHKVGELLEFDNGGKIVKIPSIGLEASVFEEKPKANPTNEVPTINSEEDLPF
jgi:hypothetical protein